MKTPRFTIKNRADVRGSYSSVPLAYHLSRVLSGSRVVHQVADTLSEDVPDGGWIIFRGEGATGFAIQHGDFMRGCSALQRTLECVRGVEAVVGSFGGVANFPLELSLEDAPPSDWRFMRVDALVGELWFATSAPPPPIKVHAETQGADWPVRCKVECRAPFSEEAGVGTVLRCDGMMVSFPEVGVYGRLVCSKGGEMSIEVESDNDAYEQQVPGVRLDLGEIEVRLSDLVSLRPGVVVNLGEVSLERCYLRLGATVLAEGRFSSKEGELLLRIDSVL